MSEDRKTAGLRVLVADDDPVSLRFLEGALRELDCEVTAVDSGIATLAATREKAFDLMLLDRRMPGSGGVELLAALRRDGIATAAIATSADIDNAIRDELLAAGYAAALAKPIRVDVLARAMSMHAAHVPPSRPHATETTSDSAETALLDDASGLGAVGGDAATLRALRLLLAGDLEALLASGMPTAAPDLAGALHRLRAACRYCGAMRLESAAVDLETKARAGRPVDAQDIAAFLDCCALTKRAIGQAGSA